jgi:hypothetical protein
MDFDNKLKPKQIPMKLYHGSNDNFTDIDTTKSIRGQYGSGFYTTTNPNEARQYGSKTYEYQFQGGKFFNPQTYQFNDQQKKILVDLYKQVALRIDQKEIDNFVKRLDDPIHRSYSENIINTLRYLGNSDDLKPILEKLGITDIQGLEVPLETPDWINDNTTNIKRTNYVVFDPKTLKLINKKTRY